MKKPLLLLPLLVLSGCAASSYCTGEQDYQKAPSVPPLQGVEGVRIPDSPSALKIPPPPANPVGYGEITKDADGDDVVSCLDQPPPLQPVLEPKSQPATAPLPPAPTAEPQPQEAPAAPSSGAPDTPA